MPNFPATKYPLSDLIWLLFPSPALNQQSHSIIIFSIMSAHSQTEISYSQCRICLQTSQNELLSSVCNCKGSIGQQHLSCLHQYYSYRLHRLDPKQQTSLHKSLLCEVCHGDISCLAVEEYTVLKGCEELKNLSLLACFLLMAVVVMYLIAFHVGSAIMMGSKEKAIQLTGLCCFVGLLYLDYGVAKLIRGLAIKKQLRIVRTVPF